MKPSRLEGKAMSRTTTMDHADACAYWIGMAYCAIINGEKSSARNAYDTAADRLNRIDRIASAGTYLRLQCALRAIAHKIES